MNKHTNVSWGLNGALASFLLCWVGGFSAHKLCHSLVDNSPKCNVFLRVCDIIQRVHQRPVKESDRRRAVLKANIQITTVRLQQLCSVLNEERPAGGASTGQAERTAHNLSFQHRFDWLLRLLYFYIYCIHNSKSSKLTICNIFKNNIKKNKYTAHI